MLHIYNSLGKEVWTSPIGIYDFLNNLRSSYELDLTLNPQETIDIEYATAEWNFTGIHLIPSCEGCNPVVAAYNGEYVSEGTYTIR